MDGVERPPSTFFVTANFFDELGARARHGRLFHVGDERPDAPPAVVLGHGLLGQPLRIGPIRRRHVRAAQRQGRHHHRRRRSRVLWSRRRRPGILGAARAARVLRSREPGAHRLLGQNGGVAMWGRLGPGASPQMAEDELATLAAELRRQHPDGRLGGRAPAEQTRRLCGAHRRGVGVHHRRSARPADPRGGVRKSGQPAAGPWRVASARDGAAQRHRRGNRAGSFASCSRRVSCWL